MTIGPIRGVPIERAEIIAVGSEMLTPSRLDTNSLLITERLNELGIDVRAKAIVGDDRDDLASLLVQALARVPLVVVTGGLGPTEDDLTREAVAGVMGLALHEDHAILEHIERRFAARGLRMPEINRRQAMVPEGAVVLPNDQGTAPGLWIERGANLVLLLPGPPREMKALLERAIEQRLTALRGSHLARGVIKIVGRTESHVEELAQPIYSEWQAGPRPISTTILAAPGQIELHLTARARTDEEARTRVTGALEALARPFGDDVFSTDGRSLEQVVGEGLRGRALRVAAAESCTGGLLTSRLTDVPGSSDYVELGVVCYSNRAKTLLAGVPESLISAHGAVSEPVASAMAVGIRQRGGTDIGVGVTGIAGPGGGSEQKPVGTVVVAVAWGDQVRVRTFRLLGGRGQVKFNASQMGLDMIRRVITLGVRS